MTLAPNTGESLTMCCKFSLPLY